MASIFRQWREIVVAGFFALFRGKYMGRPCVSTLCSEASSPLRDVLIGRIVGIQSFQNQGDVMRHIMHMRNLRAS